MWLAVLAGGLLCATALLAPVGVALMLAAALCSIVLGIVGAVRTNEEIGRASCRERV